MRGHICAARVTAVRFALLLVARRRGSVTLMIRLMLYADTPRRQLLPLRHVDYDFDEVDILRRDIEES